jgi:SAM-dependent methyltransferase
MDYLVPIMHIRSKQQPYNAKEFFELFWKSNEGFEDRHSINPTQSELHSKFHYNLVENNMIEFLVDYDYNVADLDVLDIGSGTGHWLRFWNSLFANSVTGIEISETAFDNLQKKFKVHENIGVILGDISTENFRLDKKFDVINAIGVMFHIVDDGLWERAIKNLCNHLKGGGIGLIGKKCKRRGQSK